MPTTLQLLLNGIIWEQGPMDSPHANGVERTDAVIRAAFGSGWRFRIQLPLVLGQETDPMPDIAVWRGRSPAIRRTRRRPLL